MGSRAATPLIGEKGYRFWHGFPKKKGHILELDTITRTCQSRLRKA